MIFCRYDYLTCAYLSVIIFHVITRRAIRWHTDDDQGDDGREDSPGLWRGKGFTIELEEWIGAGIGVWLEQGLWVRFEVAKS